MTGVAERLVALGMSAGEAARKAAQFALLEQALGAPAGEHLAFWVPGRIEVLGKHTDYGGGRSLLCAVERGLCVLAVAGGVDAPDGPRLRVRDARSGESAELALSPDVAPAPGHWSNYPITVARRVAANFGGPLRGAASGTGCCGAAADLAAAFCCNFSKADSRSMT